MAQRERRAIVLARAVQLLLLTVLLLVLVACVVDPAVQIRIQNKTDQRLTVTVWGYEAGDLPPGAEITYVALYSREYLVEAKNQQGTVVFRRTVTRNQLEGNEPNWPYPKWTIVITADTSPPPTPNSAASSTLPNTATTSSAK